MAATSPPVTPAVVNAARMAPTAPSHQSAGSCSVQPGAGTSKPYPTDPTAASVPASSMRTALVAVVETSSPRTCRMSATGAGRHLRRVGCPDRMVHDVLEQLLVARDAPRVDLAGRHLRLERLER